MWTNQGTCMLYTLVDSRRHYRLNCMTYDVLWLGSCFFISTSDVRYVELQHLSMLPAFQPNTMLHTCEISARMTCRSELAASATTKHLSVTPTSPARRIVELFLSLASNDSEPPVDPVWSDTGPASPMLSRPVRASTAEMWYGQFLSIAA